MANTSQQFVNSTLDFIFSPTFVDCTKGKYFGIIFCYVTTILCFLLGTPAHLVCLWIDFCAEHKIKETQVFLLNHTIMEIIYCLKCGIDTLIMFIFKNDILYHVSFFFLGLSWAGRPVIQTCICIEQYLAVLHPVTFLRYKDIKYRIAAAVVAWVIACGYGVYEIDKMIFPDIIFTFVFIIALAVISFCCVSVLCALKHPGPGDSHIARQTTRDGGNQQKRNAFNAIFSVLLLILFTYIPQALLIVFTGIEEHSTLFKCNISPFMISLNDFGVVITPLLKLCKKGHFKMSKLLKGN